jgi:hypothetical protein
MGAGSGALDTYPSTSIVVACFDGLKDQRVFGRDY